MFTLKCAFKTHSHSTCGANWRKAAEDSNKAKIPTCRKCNDRTGDYVDQYDYNQTKIHPKKILKLSWMLAQAREEKIGAVFLVVEVCDGLLEHAREILDAVKCAEFLGKFCQLDQVAVESNRVF